ncbi:TnsA-like heteromeric transposase endonuclease subunit [Streptomyces olivaceus]|uniref:TnsA-like heteromeric transposase endonuclease subunit n=1 Tax=Streptomyces olivaceus TaxID=47716 RepID=UPI000D1A6B3D|nr:TnsA-like heteromeric transposase endonuclease subunit [Streptomyces olivaceus]MBZ6211573.1 TnsA-like heteromeric transposase endonuclease subunit [Streptomyces olivaceus]
MIDEHHPLAAGSTALPASPWQSAGAQGGARAAVETGTQVSGPADGGCDQSPLVAVRKPAGASGDFAGLPGELSDGETTADLPVGIGDRLEARFVDQAGTEQRTLWLEAARGVCLEECVPVRRFPVRHGKRMAPGWWWSATNGRLVHYGSGVMRTQVMLLDWDPTVVAIACRPVELAWSERDGGWVRHSPHLMARLADGRGLLADCAGHGDISPRLSCRAAVMEAAAAAAGWQYRVLRPPDPVLAANLRWLAGYRHPRYKGGELARRAAEAFRRPRPLIEGVHELGDPIQVFPVVFHALWHGDLSAPLGVPLHERVTVTAVARGRGPG